MDITELKYKIMSDKAGFEQFLRANFDFENIRMLHDNILNLDACLSIVKTNHVATDFITVKLQDCAEIIDHIYISLMKCEDADDKYEWAGCEFWAHQYIDDSW